MRIITWNMQGASTAVGPGTNIADILGNMHTNGADVLVLQEVGGWPPAWNLQRDVSNGVILDVGIVGVGTASRGQEFKVIWYDSTENTNATHNRCSMAMISRSFTNLHAAIDITGTSLRPLLGMEVANGNWIYSIHAPSNNAAAPVAASLIQMVVATQQQFVVAGDFNCHPGVMSGLLPNLTVCHSPGATHNSGNILDYAVSNIATLRRINDGTSLISDHFSQIFHID